MRELKFKAWHKKDRKFLEAKVLIDQYHVPVKPQGDNFELDDKGEVIFLQFTGLLDRHGKEIYEGDIVRAYKPNSYLDGERLFEIRWNPSEGAFRYFDQRDGTFFLSVQSKMYNIGNNKGGAWCEVIGNIYENGDLLK